MPIRTSSSASCLARLLATRSRPSMPLAGRPLVLIAIFLSSLIPAGPVAAASTCAGFIPASITTPANLIAAVNAANGASCPGADTIDLGGNTITFTSGGYTLGGESVALPDITTPLTITNGTLTRSSGTNYKYIHATSTTLTLSNLTLSNGGGASISVGGAVHAVDTTLTVTNSTFTNNVATGYAGGAIFQENGPITVTGSTFSGNQAGYGGAICTQGVRSITIGYSLFYGNSGSANGGAISIGQTGIGSGAVATIDSSLLVGNYSGSGAVHQFNEGSFTLRNSTIAGNTINGIVLRVDSTNTIVNSIVWGNGGGEDIRTEIGSTVNVSYSAAKDWAGGGIGNITTGYTAAQIFANPNTASAGDTGSSYNHASYDWRLLTGSPAIDVGSNVGAPASDLAGTTRIQNGTIDMGAYEGGFPGPGPDVVISPASFNVNEGANANFTLTRTGSTTSALTVTLNITQGAGTVVGDYTLSGGSISAQSGSGVTVAIPAGSASVNVNLAATNDLVDENNETLTLTLADGASYNLGATAAAIATITDNDTAGITVSPTTVAIAEGGATASFTVQASTQPTANVTVPITVDAQCTVAPTSVTLVSGGTAAVSVTVTAVDDAVVEGAHTCAIATGDPSSSDSFYNALTAANTADVTANITDNDVATPVVTISPATFNVNEGANANFTLTRTGSTAGALVVTVDIAQGAGTVTADYTLTGGSISAQNGSGVTVTIPAGSASVNVNLAATNDVDAEANNTLALTLVDGAAYDLGATTSSTATIPANDLVVTNTNDSGDGSLRQATTNANAFNTNDVITFTSGANGTITLLTALPILVNNGTLTIIGNGQANTLVSGGGTVRVFEAGFGIDLILSDLTIANGVAIEGAGLHAINAVSLTIDRVTFNANSATSNGGALYAAGVVNVTDSLFTGNSAAFTGGAVSIVNGTIRFTNDLFSANTANFGAAINTTGGATSFVNTTVADSTGSAVRSGGTGVVINLYNTLIANNVSGASCSSQAGVINAQNSLIEGGLSCVNGTNTNNLTGDPALNPDFTLSSGSQAVNAGDDSLIPVGVTTDLAGATRIQAGKVDMGAYESAFYPLVTISPATASVTEGGSTAITLTRSSDLSADLTVSLSITQGSGATTGDYTLTGGSISGQSGSVTATIPAGAASSTLTVATTDDSSVEADETLTATLVDGAAYDLGTPSSGTVTILDNDVPTATISVSPATANEDGATNLIYTVTLNQAPLSPLSLDYTVGGTATNGADYATISSLLVIGTGSTTGTITVNPTADATVETDEAVTLTLVAGSGYSVGVPSSATGAILNDDVAVVTLASLSHTYDGTAKSATCATVPSGLSTSITYDGGAIAPTNAGSYAALCTITQSGYSGSDSQPFTIGKASQTVSFTSTAPASATVGGATYAVSATSSAGLTVGLAIDAGSAAVCSLSGSTVSFIGNGSCVINANQAGNANYNPATQVQQSFSVGAGSATVTLGSLSHTYDSTPKSATCSTVPSGLTTSITYDGSATAPTNAGSYAALCTVTDPSYNGSDSQPFTIAKASQTVSFTSTAPASATVGGATYAVSATSSAGLTVGLAINAGSAAVCSLSGSTVSFIGAGSCVVNADQAGNANYNPAGQVQQTFVVTDGAACIGPDADGDGVSDECEFTLRVNASHTGGAQDGSSWADAFTSLADALAAAQAGDEVWVAKGFYLTDQGSGRTAGDADQSFVIPDRVQIYGGFAGTETHRDQRNPFLYRAILSGDLGRDDANGDGNGIAEEAGQIVGVNARHLVTSSAVAASTVVDGFTLTAGDAVGGSGGGWLNQGGAPTLRRILFLGNRAEVSGGALYSEGDLNLANTLLVGNRSAHGAAIAHLGGNATLTHLSLGGNTATTAGGGLYVAGGSLAIYNSILWGDGPSEVAMANGTQPFVAFSLVQGSGGAAWNGSAGQNGGNNLDGDPLYLAPVRGDLRLSQTASPARNAGNNTATATAGLVADLAGVARIQEGTPDLGAYEQTLAGGAALSGSVGDDQLVAQRANTSVSAGAGADLVVSGQGRQAITLGAGPDLVVWSWYPDSDVINDFTLGEDRLDLRGLLATLGYLGGDPLADGYITCAAATGGAYLRIDRDGSAGASAAANYAWVKDAGLTAGGLCTAGNFIR